MAKKKATKFHFINELHDHVMKTAEVTKKGEIRINGQNFLHMDQRQVEDLRGEQIAMIFQEPLTALNPLHTIG